MDKDENEDYQASEVPLTSRNHLLRHVYTKALAVHTEINAVSISRNSP